MSARLPIDPRPLSVKPLFKVRSGFIYACEATIPVTVENTPDGIRVTLRKGGTLGRQFLYVSRCLEGRQYSVDTLRDEKRGMVMI